MSGARSTSGGAGRTRTLAMTAIASLSLLVGIMGVVGSVSVVSDGLGLTRIGTMTGTPELGTSSAPPPTGVHWMAVLFGVVRGVLSVMLLFGAIGTFGVRPSGRRFSLLFAVGWILVGGIEPFALGYRFGWPVVVSAAYPFLLLLVFGRPSWRAAFADSPRAASSPST